IPLRRALAAGLALVLAVLAAGTARAQSLGAGAGSCSRTLSGPILAEWRAHGGEQGELGCPTEAQGTALPSPTGAKAQEALFADGEILEHVTGARAGRTFTLSGCFFRLYFQFGGSGGWLGLPISEVENIPDGEKQLFEGGRIVRERASRACRADRGAAPAPAAPPLDAKSPLNLFVDPTSGTYRVAASAEEASLAAKAGFKPVETEAFVFVDPGPGLSPLSTFVDPKSGDHMTVATSEGTRAARDAGYVFEGPQGYVFNEPASGAAALELFRNPATGTSALLATTSEEAMARAKGYRFVRIEGYAPTQP
ncbi:MAG: LGFP repeat-containing protein, partial [Caulobacteraceae bacterium]